MAKAGLFRVSEYFKRMTLTQRYMLASLGVIVLGALGLGAWVSQQIRAGVISRAGSTTALYVDSFVAPLLQELGTNRPISPHNVDTLNNLLSETSLGRQIIDFKVWDLDGKIVFSSDTSLVGTTFPMHTSMIRASQGIVSTRISVEDAENAAQREQASELLEIYSPVRRIGTNEVIAIAEYYQATDELRGEIAAVQRWSWLVVGLVMGGIFVLLSGFVRRASETIENQQDALNRKIVQQRELIEQNRVLNEKVRRAAARISTIHESVLRRIGAELHDGPSQDLGLALLQLDTLNSQLEGLPGVKAQHELVVRIESLLQNSLREMRTIASGLSLPQLVELDLGETLIRVVRTHERRTATQVELEMETLPENASLPVKIAVYRIVQEALNNAHHHAPGARLGVCARKNGELLSFEISDTGPGFELQNQLGLDGHLGLAGMRERVESLGGSFEISSHVGAGTRILVNLPLLPEGG